jgi:hypothetical protein
MEVGGQCHAPAALPPGKTPGTYCIGGLVGRSGRVRKISSPPGFDSLTVQPVESCYTDCAVPAHCFVLTKWMHVRPVRRKYSVAFVSVCPLVTNLVSTHGKMVHWTYLLCHFTIEILIEIFSLWWMFNGFCSEMREETRVACVISGFRLEVYEICADPKRL